MSNIITIYCDTALSSEPKEATKVESKVASPKTRRRSTKTKTNK